MDKKNKPELSHFEQLERIENRLTELALIQKLLFHKYLEIAEKSPTSFVKLREIHQKMPAVEEKKVFGEPISYQEICQQLEVEEREIKLKRQKLENDQLELNLAQEQRDLYNLTNIQPVITQRKPSVSTVTKSIAQDTSP